MALNGSGKLRSTSGWTEQFVWVSSHHHGAATWTRGLESRRRRREPCWLSRSLPVPSWADIRDVSRQHDLERNWQITRHYLASARDVLGDTGHVGSIRDYQDYLDHNELEVAMDALGAAAKEHPARPEFWQIMAKAAGNMGLRERADEFLRRID